MHCPESTAPIVKSMKLNVRTSRIALMAAIGSLAPFSFTVGDPIRNTQSKLEPYTETLPKSAVKIKMIPVPGGTLSTGDKSVEVKSFWIASTETTWEAYDDFLSSGPPSKAYDQSEFAPDAIARPSKSYILPDLGWGHNGYPVINVSFISVQMFCRWLSSVTNKKYRVPTEAEWEWGCREAQNSEWKADPNLIKNSAWYEANSDAMTSPVAKKTPNKLGLFDTLGNVGEWATDSEGQPVLCGGTFQDDINLQSPLTRKRWSPKWQETDPQLPKSRWWLSDGPFCGFRIVCEP